MDDILANVAPDQFLLVQFGTNDGHRTAAYTLGEQTIPYFLDPATDFKAYLQRYAEAARGAGAIPIFVTPTPRNSAAGFVAEGLQSTGLPALAAHLNGPMTPCSEALRASPCGAGLSRGGQAGAKSLTFSGL